MSTTRRGAHLPVTVSLGTSERSDRPAGTGNGFADRYPEDLALLAELGVTDLRLGVDWARLQPGPGDVDDDWREWYQGVLATAHGSGLRVWLGLLERAVPAWFADEGAFTDARWSGRWWPRWVETCTELFGDVADGWYPIHDPVGQAAVGVEDGSPRHLDALGNVVVAWRDAWRILRGGPPVASSLGVRTVRAADESVPARQAARREDHLRWSLWLRALRDGVIAVPTRVERPLDDLAGSLDLLGVAFGTDLDGVPAVDEDAIGPWEERAGTMLRRAAEEGPGRPLTVTYRARVDDDDQRRVVTEALARAVTGARRDGVDVQAVFWSPAIDGPGDATGPVDRDRQPKPSAEVWPTC